jgi:hypothetical protein
MVGGDSEAVRKREDFVRAGSGLGRGVCIGFKVTNLVQKEILRV